MKPRRFYLVAEYNGLSWPLSDHENGSVEGAPDAKRFTFKEIEPKHRKLTSELPIIAGFVASYIIKEEKP